MSSFSRTIARKKAKAQLKAFKKENNGLGNGIPLSTFMKFKVPPQEPLVGITEHDHVHTDDCVHGEDGAEFLE